MPSRLVPKSSKPANGGDKQSLLLAHATAPTDAALRRGWRSYDLAFLPLLFSSMALFPGIPLSAVWLLGAAGKYWSGDELYALVGEQLMHWGLMLHIVAASAFAARKLQDPVPGARGCLDGCLGGCCGRGRGSGGSDSELV